jgi:hypothetical protein
MSAQKIAVVLAGLLCSAALEAQTCVPQLLGADRRGPAESISRTGSTLYVGTGAALLVVDVTVRAEPVERGFVNLDGLVRDVAAAGSLAVVLADTGLVFVDATDPDQPAIAGSWPIPEEWSVEHVAVGGSLAFVPATDGLHIVDFGDPASAEEIGFLAAPGTRDFVPRGTSLGYLVAAGSLVVVDFSDPTSPDALSSQTLPSGADDALAIGFNGGQLAVWGNTAWAHHSWWDLAFFALADPGAPALKSVMGDSDDFLSAVVVAGDRAYLDRAIVDISDLAQPEGLGPLPATWVRSHAPTGDPGLLYVADRYLGVLTVDVSNPAAAQTIDTQPLQASVRSGYLDDDLLVVVDRTGLRTIDVADPWAPALIGDLRFTDGFEAAESGNVLDLGSFAAISGYSNNPDSYSRLVDVSDPALPAALGPTPWFVPNAVLRGDLVYASGPECSVSVWNVATPTLPTHVSDYPLQGACYQWALAADGDRAYALHYLDGYPTYSKALDTIDFGEPATPVLLGSVPFDPTWWGSMLARGTTLLLAESDRLDLLDIAIPSSPILVGSTPLPASHGGVQRPLSLYASRAGIGTAYDYVNGDSDLRARIVDFSRPSLPYEWATLDTPGTALDVLFGPGIIVVADGDAGYSVFESCIPFADGFESGDTSKWSPPTP